MIRFYLEQAGLADTVPVDVDGDAPETKAHASKFDQQNTHWTRKMFGVPDTFRRADGSDADKKSWCQTFLPHDLPKPSPTRMLLSQRIPWSTKM